MLPLSVDTLADLRVVRAIFYWRHMTGCDLAELATLIQLHPLHSALAEIRRRLARVERAGG